MYYASTHKGFSVHPRDIGDRIFLSLDDAEQARDHKLKRRLDLLNGAHSGKDDRYNNY